MKRILFLPILCLIHLFYGCNANNDTLTEVERIIDEHPDSALYLLDYVDPSDLSSQRDSCQIFAEDALSRARLILDREERKEKEQLKYMKDGEFAVGFLSYPNMPFLQSNVANDIHYAIYCLVFGRFLEKCANL